MCRLVRPGCKESPAVSGPHCTLSEVEGTGFEGKGDVVVCYLLEYTPEAALAGLVTSCLAAFSVSSGLWPLFSVGITDPQAEAHPCDEAILLILLSCPLASELSVLLILLLSLEYTIRDQGPQYAEPSHSPPVYQLKGRVVPKASN